MAANDGDGMRPTTVGPFSTRAGAGNRPRVIPVPWIDCTGCGWRHYPSTAGGRWHIATQCSNCGTHLVSPESADAPTPPPAG